MDNLELSLAEQLLKAASQGSVKKVENLLRNPDLTEQDINSKPSSKKVPNKLGDTPLTVASRLGYHEVVKTLTDAGADTELVNRGNMTALDEAVYEQRGKIVRILLQAGARGRDKALLEAFLYDRDLNIVKIFLDEGIDVNTKFRYKCGSTTTILHQLCSSKDLPLTRELIKFVIEKGADLEARDYGGDTPLLTSTQHQSPNITKLLISYEANIKAVNNKGLNVVTSASIFKSAATLEVLIEKGCRDMINEINPRSSETALMMAFHNTHGDRGNPSKTFAVLIKNGANVDDITPNFCYGGSYNVSNVGSYFSNKERENHLAHFFISIAASPNHADKWNQITTDANWTNLIIRTADSYLTTFLTVVLSPSTDVDTPTNPFVDNMINAFNQRNASALIKSKPIEFNGQKISKLRTLYNLLSERLPDPANQRAAISPFCSKDLSPFITSQPSTAEKKPSKKDIPLATPEKEWVSPLESISRLMAVGSSGPDFCNKNDVTNLIISNLLSENGIFDIFLPEDKKMAVAKVVTEFFRPSTLTIGNRGTSQLAENQKTNAETMEIL